ncbi:MAG TPA: ArsA-related P-loop ATPase [Candidatus Binatia bacterium]|nr:ArsA-related P-loop ATPase [Candidatus Binatia bacterium]
MTQQRSPLAGVLAGKRLIVLVGEGGVGKTSTAAAIGYASARAGERVGVLTVDPAPRLGDALGIRDIDAAPRAVTLPADSEGALVAMRLDSKRTFDRMVERYAPSEQAARTLLQHPIYEAVSGSLGGSEHYMAFQRLYELVEAGEQDVLVVDTPPATNAAELLSAPARLTGLLDTGALSILAEPARILARAGGALARASMSVLLALVERITGDALQKSVGEFVRLFGDILSGLEDRAREIDALLRAPQTAFVLVARPRSQDIARAVRFHDALAEIGIEVAAIVVNRVTPAPPPDRMRPRSERLADAPPAVRGAATVMEREMDALRLIESKAMARLRAAFQGRKAPAIFALESLDVDVATLDDIGALADRLSARP